MDTLARICETLDCGITDVISHSYVSSRISLTSLSSGAARTGRTFCWG